MMISVLVENQSSLIFRYCPMASSIHNAMNLFVWRYRSKLKEGV